MEVSQQHSAAIVAVHAYLRLPVIALTICCVQLVSLYPFPIAAIICTKCETRSDKASAKLARRTMARPIISSTKIFGKN